MFEDQQLMSPRQLLMVVSRRLLTEAVSTGALLGTLTEGSVKPAVAIAFEFGLLASFGLAALI